MPTEGGVDTRTPKQKERDRLRSCFPMSWKRFLESVSSKKVELGDDHITFFKQNGGGQYYKQRIEGLKRFHLRDQGAAEALLIMVLVMVALAFAGILSQVESEGKSMLLIGVFPGFFALGAVALYYVSFPGYYKKLRKGCDRLEQFTSQAGGARNT